MTSDDTHSYTWDARNHLKQIDSGSTASFVYDGHDALQELIGTNTADSQMGSVEEVFQRTDSAGARGFLTDGLGNTLAAR